MSNFEDALKTSNKADLPPAAIVENDLVGSIFPPGISNFEISSDEIPARIFGILLLHCSYFFLLVGIHFHKSTPIALRIVSRKVVSSSVPIPRTVGVTDAESWFLNLSGKVDIIAESMTIIPTSFEFSSDFSWEDISSSVSGLKVLEIPASWNPKVNSCEPTTANST